MPSRCSWSHSVFASMPLRGLTRTVYRGGLHAGVQQQCEQGVYIGSTVTIQSCLNPTSALSHECCIRSSGDSSGHGFATVVSLAGSFEVSDLGAHDHSSLLAPTCHWCIIQLQSHPDLCAPTHLLLCVISSSAASGPNLLIHLLANQEGWE
jgi:hypothetical protein